MYFEILKNNKVLKRGKELIGDVSFNNELMHTPSLEITLPIIYHEYLRGRSEIKVYINNKIFYGLVEKIDIDKIREIINIQLVHVVNEWNYRQISTNLAISMKKISEMYSMLDFKYSDDWDMNFLDGSADEIIDYIYSRQNKLEGLTETVELTEELYWRVNFDGKRNIDIGKFGEKKPYILSIKPTNKNNIRILTEPKITHDFSEVINMATVYSNKSDTGMSSMSLREVYDNPSLQNPNFPVVILRQGINNERKYKYQSYPELAPNNDLEYVVLDNESIALEEGILLEGTFSFEDLSPFSENGEEITNEERIQASVTAYHAAIRKLIFHRRIYEISLTTEELPSDLKVGDRIRLLYDNNFLILDNCSNYLKKILKIDDWFYITSIEYSIDKNSVETNTLKLEKFLRTDRG